MGELNTAYKHMQAEMMGLVTKYIFRLENKKVHFVNLF